MSDKTMTRRIRELMQDGEPRTAAEVSALLGGPMKSARELMSKWVEAGEAHVCGHVGANHAKVFRYGPGENASMPLLDTKKARRKRAASARWHEAHGADDAPRDPKQRFSDEELDRRRRSPALWWPKADPVLVAAFRAMMADERCADAR